MARPYFYHKLIRKYVVSFGDLFSNIPIVRTDENGNEIERIKVPLSYGPKEKYVMRIDQDPNATKEIQITLPRMSYELKGFSYDKERKLNSMYQAQAIVESSTGVKTQYMGVPYDFNFELVLYARNFDDANQVIEQILPYFNPDFTNTITLIDGTGLQKDIPILFNGIFPDVSYEGNWESIRYVMYQFNFTVKGFLYGPVSNAGLIRQVIVNLYDDPTLKPNYITKLILYNGSGNYSDNDTAYQGNSINITRAYGDVVKWDNINNYLYLTNVQGRFEANDVITSASTNATYQLLAFAVEPRKMAKIVIDPNPINALPNTDYGYTTTITEYPEDLE